MSIRFYLAALAFTFGFMITISAANAGDPLASVFEQWLVIGNTAVRYDACVNQEFIKNSGNKAVDQVGIWIEKSQVSINEFPKGTTIDQLHDAARQGLTKAEETFASHKPALNQDLCNRVEQAWIRGIQQFNASKSAVDNHAPTAIDTHAKYEVLYSFTGSEGSFPTSLILNKQGTFYGVTADGGTSNSGTIFEFDPQTKSLKTLYAFTDGSGNGNTILGLDGIIYGAAGSGGKIGNGSVFKFDPKTKTFVMLRELMNFDGGHPTGITVADSGILYGADTDRGQIFRVDPQTGEFKVLGRIQAIPGMAKMTFFNGDLFGTAINKTFKFNPDSGQKVVLHQFPASHAPNSDEGIAPAGLAISPTGIGYGVTTQGGGSGCWNGCGTVYKFDVATGDIVLLHSFHMQDGAGPRNEPTLDSSGNLFGTTVAGGEGQCDSPSKSVEGCGTIFEITSKGEFLKLHDFNATDGILPRGSMIMDNQGNLYGVASKGGNGTCKQGCGTIFKITP